MKQKIRFFRQLGRTIVFTECQHIEIVFFYVWKMYMLRIFYSKFYISTSSFANVLI